MATVASPGEQRTLLEDVSWEVYEALLKCWADRPIRLTYDRGRLEIMSPLLRHERIGALIAQLIEAFTEERNIPRLTGGSTTFKKQAEQRGLEPDKCYWIQNERRMRGREDFDIATDPPPDLAIEVDITSSSLDRMSIYATLGVREVWRHDGEALAINLLQADKSYAVSDRSAALPDLLPAEVMRFLELSTRQDEVTWIRGFRAWLRQELSKPPSPREKKPRRPPKK